MSTDSLQTSWLSTCVVIALNDKEGSEADATLEGRIHNSSVLQCSERLMVYRCDEIGDAVCRQGEAVAVYDGRPNGELLMATGRVEDDNASDCLTVRVGLVQADRLFSVKKQVLESLGFDIVQVRAPAGSC